jgi:hypothetical protein
MSSACFPGAECRCRQAGPLSSRWLGCLGGRFRQISGCAKTSGAQRLAGALAKAALAASLASRVKRRPDHEIAPGIAYPAELWTRGTLIAGGGGSGKATVLRRVVDRVVESGDQMLLFDAKSELTAGWSGPTIRAPRDQHSLAWVARARARPRHSGRYHVTADVAGACGHSVMTTLRWQPQHRTVMSNDCSSSDRRVTPDPDATFDAAMV